MIIYSNCLSYTDRQLLFSIELITYPPSVVQRDLRIALWLAVFRTCSS
jgi:hypothetical protein|eukprot:COSAG02_NODE_6674_length_3426_cov_3.171626_4_plen_48_part_00